jgi:hypothetical protein
MDFSITIEEIIEGLKTLFRLMFGGEPPEWVLRIGAWTLFLIIVVIVGLYLFEKILRIWREFLQPLVYDREKKHRLTRRRHFAEYVESEIKRLNTLEAWSDYRFAELEAEVEAEGRIYWLSLLPGFGQGRLRREPSLSKAVERSREPLVLLEGEPGSGKSVALRHVAQTMASRAHKSGNLRAVIPLYMNLKELKRDSDESIDRHLIERFILRVLNRVNDRDVEEFLEDEFDAGLREGTWLFLFDSFDEIPEVLSSSEADEAIRSYGEAIRDFLSGMNRCHGIIASREYRGPRRLGWPRFRILQLSSDRRAQLIKRSGLPVRVQDTVNAGLASATSDFRVMAGNPMFLGLLCNHMRGLQYAAFPENTHVVFETYIHSRLSRDTDRLRRRFGKTPSEVRVAAECLAFVMMADPGLGLSPTRDQLRQASVRLGLDLGPDFDVLVDGLEFLKLARSEVVISSGESRPFTFAHRRFQEYFATSVVLREPDRVSSKELLTNALWRETAIVLLQIQSPEAIQPLLATALQLLNSLVSNMNLSPIVAIENTPESKTDAPTVLSRL